MTEEKKADAATNGAIKKSAAKEKTAQKAANDSSRQYLYEHVFIARPDLSTGQVDQISDRLKEVITEKGGKIQKHENWGLRHLAYRINNNRKGYYVLCQFEGSGAAVAELERLWRINEDIMRFLTLRIEKIDQEPSPLLRRYRDEDAA